MAARKQGVYVTVSRTGRKPDWKNARGYTEIATKSKSDGLRVLIRDCNDELLLTVNVVQGENGPLVSVG